MAITYQVANSEGHYLAARRLMQEEGIHPVDLKFPTILAFQVDPPGLVGMIGTHHQEDLIIAGPLVVKSDFPGPKLALKLIEAYEHAMRTLGTKSFIMHVEDGSILDLGIQRYAPGGLEHYATEGNKKFYVRRL